MDNDAALVEQVLAGGNDAYAQLVLRYAGRVLALCHARVGRPDLAEELAQETLVRGFEELASLADPARFGPWLAGIAVNTCRDWLKAKKNGQVSLSSCRAGEPVAPSSDPQAHAAEQDEVRRLLREVQALPEECRCVLTLFYYEKASYREIARLLDVSAATVNARLTRARALLRERLGKNDQEPPTNH